MYSPRTFASSRCRSFYKSQNQQRFNIASICPVSTVRVYRSHYLNHCTFPRLPWWCLLQIHKKTGRPGDPANLQGESQKLRSLPSVPSLALSSHLDCRFHKVKRRWLTLLVLGVRSSKRLLGSCTLKEFLRFRCFHGQTTAQFQDCAYGSCWNSPKLNLAFDKRVMYAF